MTQPAAVFGPYSPVRKAGNHYFISGQIGVDPSTKTAEAAIEPQTKQALINMQSLLETVGLDMGDVVKTTVFVTDINTFAAVNEVCEAFFDQPRPARSTVQVSALPKVAGEVKLLVEIEAVAYKESK